MWKFLSRGLRETFERRVTFTRKDASGQDCKPICFQNKFIPCVVSSHTFDSGRADQNGKGSCNEKNQQYKEHQGERWREKCQIEQFTLFGLLGWTGAMLAGWYVFQPVCRRRRHHRCHRPIPPDVDRLRNQAGFARCHTEYVNLFSLLSRIAVTQPLSILPKKELEITSGPIQFVEKADKPTSNPFVPLSTDETDSNETAKPTSSPFVLLSTDETDSNETAVPFGPKTAEQALDEAAADLQEAQKSVMSEIEHRIGMACMQLGKNKEALSHFQKAAELDYAPAVFNLGLCYETGLGTPKDLRLAAKYYELASKKGHATAMYNLGVFHVRGWGGVPMDGNRARELFITAAQLGQTNAKEALAMVSAQREEKPQIQVQREETRTETPKAVAEEPKLGKILFSSSTKKLDATQAFYQLFGIKHSDRNEEEFNTINQSVLQTRDLNPLPLIC